MEEVKYTDLNPALSQLPQAALSPRSGQTVLRADRETFLAPKPKTVAGGQPLQIASTQYTPTGVVLDYSELSSSASTYTFTNGSTYHIASSFEVGPGIAYFQQNACLKFNTNAYLLVYGNVSCSTSGSPTVFTSRDDNGYGQIVTNSTANPGYAAAEDLWVYYPTNQTILQNVRVRWAQSAIRYDASAVNGPHLSSAILEDSTKGLFLNIPADTLYLSGVTECNVATPVYNFKGTSSVSGTVTPDCGVLSVAMVNDPARDLSGLDTNKNSQTECSFVVLDSTNIVAAFMNTHFGEYGLGVFGPGTWFSGIPSPRMTSWAVSSNAGANFTDKGPILPISAITNGTIVVTNGAPDPMHGDLGDTTMAYDSVGNIIYLFVNSSREQTNWYGGRLWISSNKGQSFDPVNMDVPGLGTDGQHLVSSEDKPMIKVNLTNLYVAASQSISNGIGIWAAHSSNRGTNWDSYHTFEAVGYGDVRGADIAIVPDGTVYFFWLRGDLSQNGVWTNFIRYAWFSTNRTWSSAASIGPQLNSPYESATGNPLRSKVANTNDYFEDNGFPHVAYANGKIYIAYADLTTPTSTTDRGDIFITEAAVDWTNHALSVTYGPRKVNNDRTQTDQWDPSLSINPSGTELFIGYYSRQNDPVTNSWIMAYGAKAYISNGLSLATFDCFPISATNFQPLFAGTVAVSSNVWTFDPVWPAAGECVDTNDVFEGWYQGGSNFCPPGIDGQFPVGTGSEYIHFGADDYTWAGADATYFYFAWCDRTRKYQNTRPDVDINFAKIKP